MLNTFPFNTTPFNGLGVLPAAAPASDLVFNNYQLQTTEIITQILIQDNMPERDFDTVVVPRGDGELITGDFWRKKIVKVKGVIKKDTNAELEAEIDLMKKRLAVGSANLDVTIAGVVRRYIATLINGNSMFDDRKGYHITFCPFEATFVCLVPFGLSPNYNSSDFLGQNVLTLNEEITNDGSVRAKPVVILNVVAASGVTAITFTNNTRGESIQLTANISAGDYIKFDSETLEVSINNVAQDYDGGFPLLDTGENSFTIDIDGVSITYDLTVKFRTPYL